MSHIKDNPPFLLCKYKRLYFSIVGYYGFTGKKYSTAASFRTGTIYFSSNKPHLTVFNLKDHIEISIVILHFSPHLQLERRELSNKVIDN